MTSRTAVAIVGAGPYGLSLAAHLRARRVSYRIFGRPMETWFRRMPRGMLLKSEPCSSNIDDPRGELTLRRYCAETGQHYEDYGVPTSLDTFVAYGKWFQQNAVPDVEDSDVSAVRKGADGFLLDLDTGETVSASRAVIATGLGGAEHVPSVLGALSPGRVTHTSSHASLEPFAGRRVAVIGAGQSALETAALLAESGGEPVLIARRPTVEWGERLVTSRPLSERVRAPISPLTGPNMKMWLYSRAIGMFRLLPEQYRLEKGWKTLGPGGSWWLRTRVDERIPLLSGNWVVDAKDDDGGVRLALASSEGEPELWVDHVIAGTGYRLHLDRVTVLAPELRSQIRLVGGNPRLSAHFESSVRGLYFTGPAGTATFGPALRFVYGTTFASPRIAEHRAIASTSRRWRLGPAATAEA